MIDLLDAGNIPSELCVSPGPGSSSRKVQRTEATARANVLMSREKDRKNKDRARRRRQGIEDVSSDSDVSIVSHNDSQGTFFQNNFLKQGKELGLELKRQNDLALLQSAVSAAKALCEIDPSNPEWKADYIRLLLEAKRSVDTLDPASSNSYKTPPPKKAAASPPLPEAPVLPVAAPVMSPAAAPVTPLR